MKNPLSEYLNNSQTLPEMNATPISSPAVRQALYALSVLFVVFLAGCGSSNKITEPKDIGSNEVCLRPSSMDIYNSTDESMIYGLASAVSADMQIAYDRAALSARNQIAQTIQTELESYEKQVTRETSIGATSQMAQRFDQLITSSTQVSMKNSEIIERSDPCREGQSFRAHVAVGISRLSLAEDFLDRVEQDAILKEALNESESYLNFKEEVGGSAGS